MLSINTITSNEEFTNVQVRVENNREVLNKRFIVVLNNNLQGNEARKIDFVCNLSFARNGGVTGIEYVECKELSTLSQGNFVNSKDIDVELDGQQFYDAIMSIIYNSVHTEHRLFGTTYYNQMPVLH